MIIARQSTARTVTVGPVLDADGVAVTDGVVADFKISKNGGAPAALNGSATATHRHTGFYSLALTASDLDTVGQAEVTIDDTVNSMAMKELTVIEEAVYDALFAASANAFTGAAGSTKVTGVVLVDTATTLTNLPAITANWLTAAGTAADFGTEVGTAVWATAARTLTAATNITSTGGTTVPQTGDSFARLGAPAGASVSADIAAIEAQTDDIGVAGAGLTAVPWNAAWDAEVQSEVQDAIEANHLDHLLAADYDPTSKPGVATALFNELVGSDAGVSQFTANALELAPSGGGSLTLADIADAVWDEDLTGHVAADSAGAILGDVATGTPPTAAAIADAVWDEATAGHTTSGTFGEQLKTDVDAILTSTGTTIPALFPAGFSTLTIASNAVAANLTAVNGNAGAGTLFIDFLADYDNGALGASVTSVGAVGAGAITAASFAANAITAAKLDPDVTTELQANLATAASVSTLQTSVNTIDDLLDTEISALATAVADLPTNAGLTTALAAADDAVLAAIAALNNVSNSSVATAVLTTAMTEAYRSTGGTGTVAQLLYELIAHLGNSGIAGTSKTLTKLDKTTTAKVFTLDSDTLPTAIEETS